MKREVKKTAAIFTISITPSISEEKNVVSYLEHHTKLMIITELEMIPEIMFHDGKSGDNSKRNNFGVPGWLSQLSV